MQQIEVRYLGMSSDHISGYHIYESEVFEFCLRPAKRGAAMSGLEGKRLRLGIYATVPAKEGEQPHYYITLCPAEPHTPPETVKNDVPPLVEDAGGEGSKKR